MKTKQEYQAIYKILIDELVGGNSWRLFYIQREIRCSEKIQTPLESYLESVRNKLPSDVPSAEFLTQVYNNVFHTGDVPKNCNHIMMTSDLSVNTGETSALLKYWLDLDKVTELVNSHFKIDPPCRFKVKYRSSSSHGTSYMEDKNRFIDNESSAVNSVYDILERNNLFLMMSISSGMISGIALFLAAMAVASLINLSPMAILTATTVGVVAGLASFAFFTSKYTDLTTNVKSVVESDPVNVDDIFQQHFAETINVWKKSNNYISPEDRVEYEESLTI